MKKKIFLISLMICLFVCLLALTVGATAYNDESNGVKYTLHDGDEPYATVNDFIQGATVVTIPSTITVDGIVYKVTAFDTIKGNIPNYNELFDIGSIQQKSSVQTLNITSEYITVIPRVLMRDCKSLKTLNITSPINHFMHECFYGCTAINNVYIKFDNTENIDQSAFLFSGNANYVSQAVWNYNGEPINLYNVKNISPQAFASTRIGGKNVTGGQENTIIWPKKLETFGVFAFSNAHVGGTVYINAVSLLGLKGGEGNKQFSLGNYFETFIVGPDTKEIRNFNNGTDAGIEANINTVIILSKDVVNGKSRTNLFDNWGEFDLYYYADTTTATSIGKQTTIGSATQYFIDECDFEYDSACVLSLSLSATKVTDANVIKNENIVETNHPAFSETVTAPTCTTVGYTTYTCTVCGDSYNANETAIDENAHVYDDANDIECNNCGFKNVECVDHDYAEAVTEPTCTTVGYTTYTCTACGDSYVGNEVDPIPHSYGEVVTAPDCTNGGYTTYTCTACGDTYVDNATEALGHSYVSTNTYTDVLTAFTVGEVCSVCGEKGEVTEYAPLLTYKGYSAQIDGSRLTLGYNVNMETQAFLSNITYGVLIAVPGENDDLSTYEPVNPDLTINGTATAALREVNKKYDSFNLFVDGFEESNYEKNLVLCAFVTDGVKVDYLYGNTQNEVSQEEYAIPVTFAEIADACTPKYQVTFTCDETMGYLEGETSQTVYDGQSTSTVKAVAKEGYQFACWSDGTQKAEITVTPEKKAKITACFVPESTGLPVMTINTEGAVDILTKEYYINCEITLLDNTEKGKSVGSAVAEIKGRGNSTWTKFDKKPYKFKFDKKQDLFGYGNEKTWVLLADARDYSLLRNMLALNAGLSLSELQYTSKGQSVELYVNGEYRGVYYLCEQIQVKENRVNITEEEDGMTPEELGYLIEMDAWASDSSNQSGIANYTKDGDVYVTITGGQKPFVIKDPEDVFFDADGNFDAEKAAPYLEYIKGYLQDCHNAMNAKKTAENYEALCELIDVKSFAQAYIILELFKNPDVNYSSVYYYKDANGKLVCGPLWDFDMSIGNVTHKSGAGTNAQNFRDTSYLWVASQNSWFMALLQFDEFKALVGQELADNEAALRASIAKDLAYARAHVDAYEKNFEKWDLIGNTNATEKMGAWSVPAEFKAFETWKEHLDYIEEYLDASLDYLLAVYPAPTAN